MRVIVVGAGVVGLTCAVRLAEAGHDAHVLARDLPPETTSAVAAALWYPYRALPRDAVTRWSARSYEVFRGLAQTHPQSGVRMREGVELLRADRPATTPWWRAARAGGSTTVRDPAAGLPVRLAPRAAGRRHDDVPAPCCSPGSRRRAGRSPEPGCPTLPTTGVVVNATGLASRHLADDHSLQPVRGQVVRVEQVGLAEWLLESSDPTRPLYVVPREHDVVVGGTADEGDWDLGADPQVAERLLAARRRAGARPAPAPACWATGSGCGPPARRCVWRRCRTRTASRAGSCTATGTAAPA